MDIIQKIVRWAKSEDAIKVLILQGSRATKTPADELADSWDALFHALTFFRRLSVDLSHQLGFDYAEAMDKNISGFILKLRERR